MIRSKQTVAAMIAGAGLRRIGWFVMLALPSVLAACGQNGSYTY